MVFVLLDCYGEDVLIRGVYKTREAAEDAALDLQRRGREHTGLRVAGPYPLK